MSAKSYKNVQRRNLTRRSVAIKVVFSASFIRLETRDRARISKFIKSLKSNKNTGQGTGNFKCYIARTIYVKNMLTYRLAQVVPDIRTQYRYDLNIGRL